MFFYQALYGLDVLEKALKDIFAMLKIRHWGMVYLYQ